MFEARRSIMRLMKCPNREENRGYGSEELNAARDAPLPLALDENFVSSSEVKLVQGQAISEGKAYLVRAPNRLAGAPNERL